MVGYLEGAPGFVGDTLVVVVVVGPLVVSENELGPIDRVGAVGQTESAPPAWPWRMDDDRSGAAAGGG